MTAKEILEELIYDFSIEDYIYKVRDQECLGWNGPRVSRFAELLTQAKEIVGA